MGMWKSRGLCEISKALWKPFCGFHRDDISTAVFAVARSRPPRASGPVRERPRGWRAAAHRVERFYFVASSVRKSVWILVRQLRGPHLSTCA